MSDLAVRELHTARYIRQSDAQSPSFVLPLPMTWWSRPFEYAWCSRFVKKSDTVLDAACGVSHPFKFWLALHAAEVHACDRDPLIESDEAVRAEVRRDLGEDAEQLLAEETLVAVKRRQADLQELPYPTAMFDRVFCISVLEHLEPGTRRRAIAELARVTRTTGQMVMTFDVPDVEPRDLPDILGEAGLHVDGDIDFVRPSDAIGSAMWGRPLHCFRVVARKNGS